MLHNNNKKGRLEVVCGSMFSGKTEELMRRLKRAEFAKQSVLVIKHSIDTRKNESCIVSHDGRERLAFPIDRGVEKILDLADDVVDVVGFDEIQFFPTEVIDVICRLIDKGKRVIVAGLDLDFRGEPFGITPLIMAVADEVTKLKAICVKCGRDAYHTQRIVNGKSARYEDPTILVGAEECYEARCRNCFEIDKSPVYRKKDSVTQATI